MKALIVILFYCVSIFAYVDMSDQAARAADLGLSTSEYVYLMSLSGVALGVIFGLHIWKIR